MPGHRHEVLVDLFREAPELAPRLLREALGVPVPDGRAVLADSQLAEVAPASYAADGVVEIRHREDDRLLAAIIVEVQLRPDEEKRFSWPWYMSDVAKRRHCDVYLLVVASDDAMARWCATPIVRGHPDWVLRPLVLEPAAVPVVTDEADARRLPELALLSALSHGRSAAAEAIGWAAILAADGLVGDRGRLYHDLVLSAMNAAARRALESQMDMTKYEFQNEYIRKYSRDGTLDACNVVLSTKLGELPVDAPERLARLERLALLRLIADLAAAPDADAARAVFDRLAP